MQVHLTTAASFRTNKHKAHMIVCQYVSKFSASNTYCNPNGRNESISKVKDLNNSQWKLKQCARVSVHILIDEAHRDCL